MEIELVRSYYTRKEVVTFVVTVKEDNVETFTVSSKVSYELAEKRAKESCIKPDLRMYIDAHINDIADSHLEAWKDRYEAFGKSAKKVREDLNLNHDPSIEIENAEEELEKKLNDYERDYLVDKFNTAVSKRFQHKNKYK